MKKNMGSVDRILRTVVAVVVAVLIGTGTLTGIVAIIAGVLAGVFLLTSFVSFCPLYAPFGFSTCKVSGSE
ncbi:MAG: hypothetical protein COV99_02980 [Bacteroidetes bacterium CG12_big_fil_rev_8_21_14_0_65_60_17]|nr:MAG: hypothetical protein COV99_02980 [Bacteroidetes bacterium CG12_big_fil_rev_8_21_14_0_65_60_17]